MNLFGYDYHKGDKAYTINEEEAKVVRYIFRRYLEGAGSIMISRELREKGIIRKSTGKPIPPLTVRNILRNVKYKGDLAQNRRYMKSPITHQVAVNFGERDIFYPIKRQNFASP